MAIDFTSGLGDFGDSSSGPDFGQGGGGGSIMSLLQRKNRTEPQQGLGDPDYSIGRAATDSQFPEAAAYERLEGSRHQAQKVAEAFTSLGIKVPDNIKAIQEGGYMPDEPGFAERAIGAIAGNPVGKGALTGLNWLGGVPRLIQTGLKEVTGAVRGQDETGQIGDFGGWDIFHTVFGSPEDMEEILLRTGIDVTSGSQLLGMWGWGEEEGALGKTARFTVHAAIEMFTDPLSYLSLGAGGVTRKVLAEQGDAVVRRVTAEALDGVTDSAAHKLVARRYDELTEGMFERAMAGDVTLVDELFTGSGKKYKAQLKKELKGGNPRYEALEDIADQIEEKVRGNADSLKSNVGTNPGKLLHEMRDQVVGPTMSKNFADVPEEWVEHLPAYARGGMRVIRPWSFTASQLSKGWVIPGTVGSGKTIANTIKRFSTDVIARQKFPFADSKTVRDVFESVGNGLDYHKTLIRAVKDDKITGGEYMLIQDAMSHGAINEQLERLTPKLLASQDELLGQFDEYIKKDKDLQELLPKPGIAGKEALDAERGRVNAFSQSMYDFIISKNDDFIINGKKIDPSTQLYEKAVEFRTYTRSVMDQYNSAIKKAIPEYTEGLENYLPMAIDKPQREFLKALAMKAPQVANDLALKGPQGASDYFVGALLNSIGSGGVGEAILGSSAHLNHSKMGVSPIVGMLDGQPLMMLDQDIAKQMAELLGAVDVERIGAKQLNDLIEGKLKEMGKEFNVPMPSSGHVRVFNEDPFNLVNAYAHSMEQTLRQRNAIEAMKEFGLVSGVDSHLAVQNTIAEIINKLDNPKVKAKFEAMSARIDELRKGDYEPLEIRDPAKARAAADHIRTTMTTHDKGGWGKRIYDRRLSPEEKVNKYLGSDDMEQVVTYRVHKPSKASGDRDAFRPERVLGAAKRGEMLTENLPPNAVDAFYEDGNIVTVWKIDGIGSYELEQAFGKYRNPKANAPLVSKLDDNHVKLTMRTDSAWEIRSVLNDVQFGLDPNFVGGGDTSSIIPRSLHMGSEGVMSHISRGGHVPRANRPNTHVMNKIRLKKNARIAPTTMTDEEANAIQDAFDKWFASGNKGQPGDYLWHNRDWESWNHSDEVIEEMNNNQVFRYINGGEDAGSISYVVTDIDAIQAVNQVDPFDPIGWYDLKRNKWYEDLPVTDDVDDVFGEMRYVPNVDEDGHAIGVNKYQLRVPGLEDMPAADRVHVQREGLRMLSARQGDNLEIVGTDTSQVLWKGSVKKNLTHVEDATVIADAPLAFRRAIKGTLDAEDDLLAGGVMVQKVAKAWRREAKKRGTYGSEIGNYKRGDKKIVANRAFNPRDRTMLDKFEDPWDSSGGQLVFNNKTDETYWVPGSSTVREDGETTLIKIYQESTNNDAVRVIKDHQIEAVLDDAAIEAALADARWQARRSGFIQMHHDLSPRAAGGSLPHSLNIKIEHLNDIVDWDQLDDFEVYSAAQAQIRAIGAMPEEIQGRFLSDMRNEFGKEFVAEATGTTEDIVEIQVRHAQFVDTVRAILQHGRAPDGTIGSSTQFLASKGDPMESLLKSARKQAEALGIDPDTFEPVRTAIHNQTYVTKHPVTGEVMKRNLVNPRLFGVGGPALEGELIQAEIADWFAQITDNSLALYTPIGFATFSQNMRQATKWWKAMSTITRPTFHIRNLVGGTWNNQIIGVGPKDYALVSSGARKIRKAMNEGLSIDEAMGKLAPRQEKVFRAAFDEGVFGNSFATSEIKSGRHKVTTQAKGALKSVNPLSLDGFGVKVGGTAMETLEDFMRMSAFAAWYDPSNPATAKVAREMTLAVHFDYKNLTKFETQVKEFVPFFVWQRRNIPLQLQVLAERPGLMTRYAHLMEAAQENFGSSEGQGGDLPGSQYLSAFAVDTGIVLNEDTPFWSRVMLDPDIPVKDLFETFDSMNPLEILGGFTENFHPLYSAAMDFQTQQDYGDVNAPAPINVVLTQLARAGLFDESLDGDVQMPYFMRTLFNATAPFANEYMSIAEAGAQAVGGDAVNDPKKLQQMGIASEGDPDSKIGNALSALGMTLGKGVGVQSKIPRDSASAAFQASEEVQSTIAEAMQNIPGFREFYEENYG